MVDAYKNSVSLIRLVKRKKLLDSTLRSMGRNLRGSLSREVEESGQFGTLNHPEADTYADT